jgi:Flp pilus assembly pilin Flp
MPTGAHCGTLDRAVCVVLVLSHNLKETNSMKALIARFVCDDSGQDVIEYGLLVGIIASVCVLTLRSLGGFVLSVYSGLAINL